MKHFYKTKTVVTTLVVTLLCLQRSFSGYGTGLIGTYTINPAAAASSTNYKNFSSAVSDLLNGSRSTAATGCSGAMDAGTINGPGVSGPVTFLVKNTTAGTALTYSECIEISTITGASAINTITFQGAGLNGSSVTDSSMVVLTFNGTSAANNYAVYLHGANYVKFRKMTLSNPGGTTNSYGNVVYMDNGASYDTITACQIISQTATTQSAAVAVVYAPLGSKPATISNCCAFTGNYIANGSYGVYLGGWSNSVADNAVNNLVSDNTITGFYLAGVYMYYQTGGITSGNTITTTSASLPLYGIWTNYNYGQNTITKNKIAITSSSYAYGIYPQKVDGDTQSTSGTTISNNFVAVIANGNTSKSYGIYMPNNSVSVALYFNSVDLSGTTTMAGYALYWSVGTTNNNGFSNIQNNIFANTASNTAGFACYSVNNTCFGNGLATSSNSGWNYNCYYNPNNSGSYLNSYGGTGVNYATWKTNMPGDLNSQAGNPGFNSATDLHSSYTGTGGAYLYGKGTPVSGITTDIDNQTRINPSCIGADEFFNANPDAGISAIGILSSGANFVTATITNYSTVTLTSATVTLRIGPSTYTPTSMVKEAVYSWTGSLTTGQSAQITFPGLTTTFTTGTTYYVAVHVTSPNGTTLNIMNDSMLESIRAGMAGVYTINPSVSGARNFTTFNSAKTAMMSGVVGPCTFVVSGGTYSEQLALGSITGVSAVNNITFVGATNDSSAAILTNSGAYTLQLTAASYYTFRKMTIQSTGGYAVELLTGSVYDSFSHCQIVGLNNSSTSTSYSLIYIPIASTAANNCNYAVFANSYLHYGSYGFYGIGYGSGAGSELTGLVFTGNVFKDQYNYGLYSEYLEGLSITNNVISTGLGYSGYYSIFYIDNSTYSHQAIIKGNKITGISGGAGMYIINDGGASGFPMIICNNEIQGGSGTNSFVGLQFATAGYINAYFNTVYVTTGSAAGYAFYSTGNSTDNVENNIFVNDGNGSAAGYAAYLSSSTVVGTLDYNNYFVGTGGTLFKLSSSAYSTLASWRSAGSFDSHSISVLPMFTSSSAPFNLDANSCSLKNRGIAIAGISTDINGVSRPSILLPDIGANQINGIAGQWTGSASTNWFSAANWCNDTVPGCSTDTTVNISNPAVTGATTNNPVISTGTTYVHNLNLNAGGSLTINGHIKLCGKYLNTGGTLILNAGDTFDLSSSGDQSFVGGTFYNLVVSGTGNKTMTSNVTINHGLYLQNGIIVTNNGNADDTVILNPSAVVTENSNAYVLGYIKTTHVLSPAVRDTFGNIGAGLTIGSGYTHSYDTIQCIRHTGVGAIQTGQVLPGNYQYQGIERTFVLTPSTNGRLGLTQEWHYLGNELNGIPQSELATFRRETGRDMWNYVGYSSRNASTNTITNTGQDSLSEWTFGSSLNPLPVLLDGFTATLLNDKQTVSLDWKTASEVNNDHFIIDRSIDGKNFESIGIVKGNASTGDPHTYNYIDNNVNLLISCSLYYQLRQVDMNGNINNTDAGVKEVTICQMIVPGNTDKAWYNQDEDRVYFNIERTSTMGITVILTDNEGKIITSQNISAMNGFTQGILNMTGFAKGIYNVSITDMNGSQTLRVVKY